MSRSINLFVPGRLCLFGEHSDWAGMYRTVNADIVKGAAIVSGTEQGIYATAERADKFIMCGAGEISEEEHWECEMDTAKLLEAAQQGGYFSYVAGVASYINDNYSVGGGGKDHRSQARSAHQERSVVVGGHMCLGGPCV